MRHRTTVLALGLCLLSGGFLWAEGGSTESPQPSAVATVEAGATASQVAPGALPGGWTRKRENGLRRFEIIAFGSFPIALFYTNLGFELTSYVQNNFDSRYAPWPFSGEVTSNISDSERFGRMGVAAGLSLLVAGVDAIIVAGLENRKARLEASARAQGSPP